MSTPRKILLRSLVCGVLTCAAISIVSTKMETHALQALLQNRTPNVPELAIQLLILGIGVIAAVLLNVRDLSALSRQPSRKPLARAIANVLGSFVLGFVAVGMFLPVR